ncbi:MAG TPA: chromate transporter [Acholeplasma sp.]|nr:chromate transporter [Acholeplasma sp.]
MKKEKKPKHIFELFWIFFKIGAFTFGGGLAMLPLIRRELAERKKWISDEDMLDMLALAECTPGVIAVNSATYVGYSVGGFWGSLLATIGVILPSIIVITIISFFYQAFLENKVITQIFYGVRIGAVVLILNTLMKLYKVLKKDYMSYGFIVVALVFALLLDIPTITIIIFGMLIGAIFAVISAKKEVETYDGIY